MTSPRNQFGIAALCFSALLVLMYRPAMAKEPDFVPKHFTASKGSPLDGYFHVELDGSALLYRAPQNKKAIRIVPTQSQWQEFRRAIDEINIWQWRSQYSRAVSDSEDWSLHIEYSDQSLATRGYASYPEVAAAPGSCLKTTWKPYRRFLGAVRNLVGNRPFGSPAVGAVDYYEVAELQLVATHPAKNPREQWAAFRDPTGKVHRVWRHFSDCCTRRSQRWTQVGAENSPLREVRSDSVTLLEVCEDAGGDWFERNRVVKKLGAR